MRHRDRNSNHNGKLHYKMYKAGGKWTFCSIVLVSVATASLLGDHSAYAASEPATQTSQSLKGTSSIGSASPSNSMEQTQQYITGAQPPKSSPDTATPAVTSTDDQVKQPDNNNSTTITPANFQDSFDTHGNAHFNSDNHDTITLTDYAGSQQGSITLKNKINLGQGFDIEGQVNLGAVDQVNGNGGDGIAFGFHDANSDTVGNGGAGLGLGGIPDAIGWKADTTYNWAASNDATADPAEFSNGPRKPNTPDFSGGQAFGAFIESSKKTDIKTDVPGIVSTIGVTPGKDSAQVIDIPTPGPNDQPQDDPKNWRGEFKDIAIKYQPNVDGKKLLTINYDNKVWEKDITDWATDKTDTAFFISAGTAANLNLQQFRLKSMVYQPAASVNVKYVYTTDTALLDHPDAPVDPATVKEIPNYVGKVDYPSGTFVGDPYLTYQQSISGYTFVRLYDDSLPANGTLKKAGNNGTITYLYVQNGNGGQKATIKFWDKTENKQLGQTVTIEGKNNTRANFSDQVAINAYVKAGYAYDPQNDQIENGIVFDNNNDVDQTFTVELTHQIEPTDPAQVITRTIHYVKASDGSELVHPSSTSLTFTRTMNKDLVTNTTTYSDWSEAQEFNSVISPTIVGYVPDQTITPALQVNLQNGVPTNDQLNVYVKYNDITGKVPDSDPQAWTIAQVPDPVYATGKLPDTDPQVWTIAQVPDPVYATGEVPDTDPQVWTIAQVPDPVYATGEVPDTDPQVWTMAQTPDPVYELTETSQTRTNVPAEPVLPNTPTSTPINGGDTDTPINTVTGDDTDVPTPPSNHQVTNVDHGNTATDTNGDAGTTTDTGHVKRTNGALMNQEGLTGSTPQATQAIQATTSGKSQPKLPQTNESNATIWSLLGFSLMSILSLLGFTKRNKHDNITD